MAPEAAYFLWIYEHEYNITCLVNSALSAT
jgi:hypothetical protein